MDGHETTGYAGRLIRANTVPAAPNDKIATVNPAQAEAERLIARAEAQAGTIISRAEGVAQRIIDKAEREARTIRETRLAQDLLAFNRKLRRELDEVRPLLAKIVTDGVEAIVGSLPEDDRAERMIRRALRDLDDARAIVLHAARQDQTRLAALVQEMHARGETAIRSVEPDSDLAPGTCRLDSGGLSVEIGLSAQIDVLESLLLRERSGEVTAPLVTPASSDRSTP